MGAHDSWLQRSRLTQSTLDPWPAQALSRSLGSPAAAPADRLPLLWHWLYFLEHAAREDIGHDGHPRKGDFYPPIEQPRRMFVGGRSRTHAALRIGSPAELEETIQRCEEKQGGMGRMTLLTVAYRYSQDGVLCVEEERDFMYLPERSGESPEARTEELVDIPSASWQLDVPTDPVLLFRFSALTFNGHRIHYDREYAQQQESYPDLVVHGPMTALLLADLARFETGRELVSFGFRARAPLFVGDLLRLRGEPPADDGSIQLSAYRPDGQLAMTAEAFVET